MKKKTLQGLSSTLDNRALFPKGTEVKSSHMGINGFSSSNELDARYVQLHQKTIKSKKGHTWKASTCLQHLSWSCVASKA